MRSNRTSVILETVGDVASMLTVVVPLIAIVIYRIQPVGGKSFDWNPYIAAFLLFFGVAEYIKRNTLLKKLVNDVGELRSAEGTVTVHESRAEMYKAIARRVQDAKAEILDTTWGPDVPPAPERDEYRNTANSASARVNYTEIYSVPSEKRLEDLRKTLDGRPSSDETVVIHVRDVPIPDIMVIDERIVMLSLPYVRGKGTGCFLEIEHQKLARFFKRFLEHCVAKAHRVELQKGRPVIRSTRQLVEVERA